MLTLKNLPHSQLALAVARQVGGKSELLEIAQDVNRHGAAGGFNGFIYYSETVGFFRKNKKAIIDLVEEMADDFGKSPQKLVATFQCLDCDETEAAKALYGRYDEGFDLIYNALAWFALETVCNEVVEAE